MDLKSNSDGTPPFNIQIEPYDPWAKNFDKAIKNEIEGLIKRKTWKVVCRSEVPEGANVLGWRFVLAIKDEGTGNEIWKARFMVQGHKDFMKNSLVHNLSVDKQHAIKILVEIAAIFGFRLFSTDVTYPSISKVLKSSTETYL